MRPFGKGSQTVSPLGDCHRSSIICRPGAVADAAEAVDVVAEADVHVAGVLVVAVAAAAVLVAELPGAAANDFRVAFFGPARILLGGLRVVIDLVEVVAPLPDIAADVVQAEGIELLLTHRLGMPAGVLVEPGVVAQLRGVAEEIGPGPGPASTPTRLL
jgi:hypothetical protein